MSKKLAAMRNAAAAMMPHMPRAMIERYITAEVVDRAEAALEAEGLALVRIVNEDELAADLLRHQNNGHVIIP